MLTAEINTIAYARYTKERTFKEAFKDLQEIPENDVPISRTTLDTLAKLERRQILAAASPQSRASIAQARKALLDHAFSPKTPFHGELSGRSSKKGPLGKRPCCSAPLTDAFEALEAQRILAAETVSPAKTASAIRTELIDQILSHQDVLARLPTMGRVHPPPGSSSSACRSPPETAKTILDQAILLSKKIETCLDSINVYGARISSRRCLANGEFWAREYRTC